MSVEDIGEVNVDDNDQRSNNKEDLHSATWENWALIQVGFAFCLVFFISIVALFNFFILIFSSTHFSRPFLRYPTNLICEQHVADKDVSVHEEVAEEDEGHAKAEKIQAKETIEPSVTYQAQDEGNQHCNLNHAANAIERPVLFHSADAESKEN